jgi:hypothetical protein
VRRLRRSPAGPPRDGPTPTIPRAARAHPDCAPSPRATRTAPRYADRAQAVLRYIKIIERRGPRRHRGRAANGPTRPARCDRQPHGRRRVARPWKWHDAPAGRVRSAATGWPGRVSDGDGRRCRSGRRPILHADARERAGKQRRRRRTHRLPCGAPDAAPITPAARPSSPLPPW